MITVCLLTYNHAKFLPDALAGLAAQTLRPIIDVSDDASPNDSEASLREIVERYEGARFNRNRINQGAVPHFRQRVAAVKTPYYMLHAADDYLVDPHFLEDAVKILEANPSIVAVTAYPRPVDAAGQHLRQDEHRRDRPLSLLPGPALRAKLAVENIIPAVCTVVRTSVHDRLPPMPIDNPLCHDWQQWYLLTFYGDFARIERTVINYRFHDSNLSSGAGKREQMWAARKQGFAQLLARPELSEADRAALRAGLTTVRVRNQALSEWPRIALRHPSRMTFRAMASRALTLLGRGLPRIANRVGPPSPPDPSAPLL